MDVDCEGCAGCCLDWRPLAPDDLDHERGGERVPLDDTYNLAPLGREEVRAFVDAGLADALTPRLWRAEREPMATVAGIDLAAVEGRPAFFVGLRKPPKPVAPFGADPVWLPACAFLDPGTLQCRIHNSELYPRTCAVYPGDNLELGAETECERVERVHGGDRLLEDDPPDGAEPPLGPGALGSRVFTHPDPGRIDGAVSRYADGETTLADRAEFAAVAAASSPGTTAVDGARYERARERALSADSWVGRAADEWAARAAPTGADAPDPAVARTVEDDRGAPGTPGWDRVRDRAGDDGT